MISSKGNLEAEIILYSINKSNNLFLSFLENEIDVEEMKNRLQERASSSYTSFEDDFKDAVSSLMAQKVLVEDRPFYLGVSSLDIGRLGFGYFGASTIPEKIPEKLFLNKEKLKERIAGGSVSPIIKKVYIEKESEAKKEIKNNLEELKNNIKNKKSESALHKFIRENKLIQAPFINHEFMSIIQNRQDFLIQNEFGEFEIWELKSSEFKLFDVDKRSFNSSEKYKRLKSLTKTKKLNKAIEQLSVYKKEFIDYNITHPNANTMLKEHIYNAKLILVIGSNEEFEGENKDLYLEKLNLERYMLNNINIITWEMFYEKVKNYWRGFLGE